MSKRPADPDRDPIPSCESCEFATCTPEGDTAYCHLRAARTELTHCCSAYSYDLLKRKPVTERVTGTIELVPLDD